MCLQTEKVFSKLKAALKRNALLDRASSLQDLQLLVHEALLTVTPEDCVGYIAACGPHYIQEKAVQ